jgi:hypothetical protein
LGRHPDSTVHHEEQINEQECDENETADEDVRSESEHGFVPGKVRWRNVSVFVIVLMHGYSLVANALSMAVPLKFPQTALFAQ